MKKINKNPEPISLTNFKINNSSLKYLDLNIGFQDIRIDVRTNCLIDQFYLCGYCCNRIDEKTCHNEHIIPQNSVEGENLTLDFDNNIIASCNASLHCGHKKDNNKIDLTPLMTECESEIIYQLNGKMTHTTPRAQATITTLGIRNKSLENKRKQIIDLILFEYVDDLSNLNIEEDYYLELIIDELSKPNVDGRLEAFVPVITNVIRQYIS